MRALSRKYVNLFVQRLMGQRKVSAHTLASYRDTFRLLLKFAEAELHRRALELELTNLPHRSLRRFWTISNPRAGMSPAASTSGSPRSARSSGLPQSRHRNTRCWSSVSWRHPRNDGCVRCRLPRSNRDQRTADSTGSKHMDRPPRLCTASPRGADRPAVLRNYRLEATGRDAWDRRPCPLRM